MSDPPLETAAADSQPLATRRLPGWTWVAGWLAFLAAMWAVYSLLLVPPPGQPPLTNIAVASVFGLIFLIVEPIGLALFLAGGRSMARGAIWVGAFTLAACVVLAVMWRGESLPVDLLLEFGFWWAAWGGCWLGIIAGARRMGLSNTLIQPAVGIAAAVWSTSIFWLDAGLRALSSHPDFYGMATRAVRFSPLHAYLGGVLDQQIFRQGRMYMNPDGEPLSILGEYLRASDAPQSAIELGLQWLLLGAIVGLIFAALGAGMRAAKRRWHAGRPRIENSPQTHAST